jgi:hypothetical protein
MQGSVAPQGNRVGPEDDLDSRNCSQMYKTSQDWTGTQRIAQTRAVCDAASAVTTTARSSAPSGDNLRKRQALNTTRKVTLTTTSTRRRRCRVGSTVGGCMTGADDQRSRIPVVSIWIHSELVVAMEANMKSREQRWNMVLLL